MFYCFSISWYRLIYEYAFLVGGKQQAVLVIYIELNISGGLIFGLLGVK